MKTLDSPVSAVEQDLGAYEEYEPISVDDLVLSYIKLYQKNRKVAFDALDSLQELNGMNEFKTKLLFSVIVVRIEMVFRG